MGDAFENIRQGLIEAIEFVRSGEEPGIRIHQIPTQPGTDEANQDDLERYIAKRKARNPQFAARFEEEYTAFKLQVQQQVASDRLSKDSWKKIT